MRIALQPAYLIHARKISDSRLLVDFLTRDYGVVGAVARAPSKKKSPHTLFRPALISWLGNNSLKTLTEYEFSHHQDNVLVGSSLYCGFYLNVLLLRLMPKGEACEHLFSVYQHSLLALSAGSEPEPVLRRFELLLLQALGYAIDLHHEGLTGEPLDPTCFYYLDVAQGFTLIGQAHWPKYSGQAILAIADGDYSLPETKRTAKQLSRLLLKPLLGTKPLKSRELFAPPASSLSVLT